MAKILILIGILLMIFGICIVCSGCSSDRGRIICYQNEDYLAFSTIIYDNQDIVTDDLGNVDQQINAAIANVGKAEGIGTAGIEFIITRINDPYRIGPIPTTQWEWQYWNAVNSKLGKYLEYPY